MELAHDPREDLRRVAVPVPAVTGDEDLQVDPADLAVVAATVPGHATTVALPDVTHTLRRQPGSASSSAYRKERREPVNPEALATVVRWCREVTGLG
ncbi:hypothetical protein [Blastococcus colisei]|uniref:hypothetical protein n=1 Tax=Blastococcus colisei TaxID=1564162 RepID=UPI00115145E8|nr:hypothetical protein [Blastococcus colisei]